MARRGGEVTRAATAVDLPAAATPVAADLVGVFRGAESSAAAASVDDHSLTEEDDEPPGPRRRS